MHALVWFRNDLRIHDNPALWQACQQADRVTAIYIDCPEQWRRQDESPAKRRFVKANLAELARALAGLGIPLLQASCADFSAVAGLLEQQVNAHGCDALFANAEPGEYECQRDTAVANQLSISCNRYQADCVIAPGSLQTGSGGMYRVFTPYSRAWLSAVTQQGYAPLPAPAPLAPAIPVAEQRIDTLEQWPAGETAALQRLRAFCTQQLYGYSEGRDNPALDATSKLSAYLAIGVLSPKQCLSALEQQLGFLPLSRGETGFSWLNELIWREFYRHLLYAFPQLSKHKAFKPETDRIRWRNNDAAFEAWCQGQTGYPIVDAAMRCLNQTGWMHNRLRMIVASFLSKDLHIDWRWGERYFMRQLIDGDLAANNGGWQWAASTGADAAPYFRVFNPTTQGERFDPDGRFVKRWLPELSDVPARLVHTPHSWLAEHAPDSAYPTPIVDHRQARQQAIELFNALK